MKTTEHFTHTCYIILTLSIETSVTTLVHTSSDLAHILCLQMYLHSPTYYVIIKTHAVIISVNIAVGLHGKTSYDQARVHDRAPGALAPPSALKF